MHFYPKSYTLGDLSAPFTRTVIEDLRGWPRVEKLVQYKSCKIRKYVLGQYCK